MLASSEAQGESDTESDGKKVDLLRTSDQTTKTGQASPGLASSAKAAKAPTQDSGQRNGTLLRV